MRDDRMDTGFEQRLKALFSDLQTPDSLCPERMMPLLANGAAPRHSRGKVLSIAAMFVVMVALGGLSIALLRPQTGFGAASADEGAAVTYGVTFAAQEEEDAALRTAEEAPYALSEADDGQEKSSETDRSTIGETTCVADVQSEKKYDDCLDGCVGDEHVPECPHHGEGLE